MAAVKSSSISPLRYGKLAPQDEWTHTARDEHSTQRQRRECGITAPGQAVFTKRHVGIGQTRLQLLHDGPLRGRRVCRVDTDDLELRRRHDDVGAARDAPKMGLEPLSSVQWILGDISHRGEGVVGECVDDLRGWQQSRRVAAALILRAVRGDPLRDETRLLLVQGEVLGAALDVFLPAGATIGAEASVRLTRNVTCRSDIDGGVKHHAPRRRGHEAAAWRGHGTHHRALRGVAKEVAGDLRPTVTIGLPRVDARGPELVRKLVVLGGFVEQVVEGMRTRRRGKILLIASLLAYQGVQNFAVYAAAKVYVLRLGEALHRELKRDGVTVTVLSPGMSETGFATAAQQKVTPALKRMMMQPAPVVRAGIRALQAGRISVVPGWANKAAVIFTWATPRWLHQPMFSRIMNG